MGRRQPPIRRSARYRLRAIVGCRVGAGSLAAGCATLQACRRQGFLQPARSFSRRPFTLIRFRSARQVSSVRSHETHTVAVGVADQGARYRTRHSADRQPFEAHRARRDES